jgi:hypothetical protein
MAWKPKVTVAVVIEHDCKILLIEEHTMLFDQPTDHLEPNESLQRAEVLKESVYEFKPQYLVNIFCWHTFVHGITYTSPSPAHPRSLLGQTLNADLIRSILE